MSKISITAAHLVGNGLLMLLGYYWLGLGESNAMHLAFSAAILFLAVLAAIWLHGTALVLFANKTGFPAAAKRTLKSILPLFLLTLLILLIYWALDYAYNSFGHEAFVIGSYSTMKLRRPVAPDNVLKAFHFFIWLMRWFVVPIFAVPLAAEVANQGWAGFRKSAFARSKKVTYWLAVGILTVTAIHLPLHLFLWIPKVSSFSMQVVSVTLRFGFGYLLFTFALLALEYFTSAGKPALSQPKTVVSP